MVTLSVTGSGAAGVATAVATAGAASCVTGAMVATTGGAGAGCAEPPHAARTRIGKSLRIIRRPNAGAFPGLPSRDGSRLGRRSLRDRDVADAFLEANLELGELLIGLDELLGDVVEPGGHL